MNFGAEHRSDLAICWRLFSAAKMRSKAVFGAPRKAEIIDGQPILQVRPEFPEFSSDLTSTGFF